MKNVTISLDDETHRKARVRAAELGTSLSALVKDYLTGLAAAMPQTGGVREMQSSFQAAPLEAGQPGHEPPYVVDGTKVWTPDGKPRRPGTMRGMGGWTKNFEGWSQDILDSFDAWPYDDEDFDPLPFDENQLPKA